METTLTTTTPAALWAAATGEDLAKELTQIPQDMAAELIEKFVPFAQQVNEIAAMAADVNVTEEDDAAGMAEARRLRLAMKAVRVEADKVRKAEKEYALVVGKSVDWLGRSIRERAELVEARLEASEKYAERMEEARRAAVAAERTALLLPYVDDVSQFDLFGMTEAAFNKTLSAMKAAHEAAQKAEAEAAAERARVAEEQRAEQERIRQENERLRADLAARKAEADRAFAELRAKADAEEAAARAAREAERAAANADDVEKMRALYRQIDAIQMPEVAGVYASIAAQVAERLGHTLVYMAEQMRRASR